MIMRVIELTIALIGLSLFGSEAFLGDFGLAINDKSGKPIVETDPDQVQRRPIKMRYFHQNENCRISAILGLRKKFL